MTRVEFIRNYTPVVNKWAEATHIFPEIVFAQAIIESSGKDGSFGDNYNAKQGNNYFGIKASKGWKGDTIKNPTVKSENNIFRAYPTVADSIADYFRFLVSNKRYAAAGVFSAQTWQQQAEALARAGYAGAGQESHYISLIGQVVKSVQKVLGKTVDKLVITVTTHKTESVLTGLGIIAAITLGAYLYGKR